MSYSYVTELGSNITLGGTLDTRGEIFSMTLIELNCGCDGLSDVILLFIIDDAIFSCNFSSSSYCLG